LYQIKNWNYSLSKFIKIYFEEFKNFWYIRNELVHKYQNYIDITDTTIDNIQKYVNILKNPKTCYDYFKVDVFQCSQNDKLVDIIKIMKDNLYTNIPVYSSDNQFVWILSESSITYFIWEKIEEDGTLLLENIKIWDINLDNWNDLHEFISRRVNIYEIEEMFNNSIKDNKRLGAIFITNLWKDSEKIDGIITAWDLPKIKNLYL